MTSLANADSDAILSVELDERSYPIHIVQGGLDGLGNALAMGMEGGPLVVISDTTVEDLYGDIAASSLVSRMLEEHCFSM